MKKLLDKNHHYLEKKLDKNHHYLEKNNEIMKIMKKIMEKNLAKV